MDIDYKALGETDREKAVSKQEAEVKLLRLEAEFYRTCNAVRQNGVELHQVKCYLLKEQLDLEIKKRKRFEERAIGTIYELQVCTHSTPILVCDNWSTPSLLTCVVLGNTLTWKLIPTLYMKLQ